MKSSEFIIESPLMQTSIDNINKHNYTLIDQVDVGNHILALIKDPQNNYHLGFTQTGKDFTDYSIQSMQHDTDGRIKIKEITSKIKEWLTKYKRLMVSSSSLPRVEQYKRIFKMANANIKSDTIHGHPVLIITEDWLPRKQY